MKLQRYDIQLSETIYGASVEYFATSDGDWVKFEDLEELFNKRLIEVISESN